MTSQQIFDALLVLRYQAGDKKAMDLLVQRHHKRLCKHSYWYTKDMDAAQDIVQDSWGVILQKIHGLKDANAFGSWSMRIVTRRTLNFLKRNKHIAFQKEPFILTVAETSDTGRETSQIKRLGAAIKKLPKDHQAVLRLFYTEGYSLREISTILTISTGTVKSRLFHAREKLKTVLKN